MWTDSRGKKVFVSNKKKIWNWNCWSNSQDFFIFFSQKERKKLNEMWHLQHQQHRWESMRGKSGSHWEINVNKNVNGN